MTSDIVAFIRARLEEDEDRAHDVHRTEQGGRSAVYCDNVLAYGHDRCTCGYPDRVLREVAAKRAILSWVLDRQSPGSTVGDDFWFPVYALAQAWSDHPERELQAKHEQDAAIAAARQHVDEIGGRDGWEWLNGWPRLGDHGSAVLMGTAVHCLGCGRFLGITTVVFPEGWQPPGPDPVWPLSQDDCPICRTVE